MFASPRLVLVMLSAVGLVATLGGCTSRSAFTQPASWLTPYRPDVVQGNFVSREQVEQLRPGLSRVQVRNLLGTPLVSSLFHADRWDYVFSFQRRGGEVRLYRYAVFFQGDELARFEGDTMPSESEFVGQLDSRRKLGKVPVLEATPEQLQAAEAKARSARRAESPGAAPSTTPAAAAPSNTNYPPLEGARP